MPVSRFSRPLSACCAALALLALAPPAQADTDPLSARLHTQDAERFAALFRAGTLSAADLQAGYLDGAGRGVQVFTPNRIENAAHLAARVQARRADYAHAIATCLPLAESLNAELRAVYLAFRGLLPERPLPSAHLVFGAGNSGGTAQPDAQVLGLEVVCKAGTTPAEFRATLRRFFAHETVHTWQQPPRGPVTDPLLRSALIEGVPDLLAELVTGLEPDPAREAWARPREAEVWARFNADRAAMQAARDDEGRSEAYLRWFGNANRRFENLPAGWPGELGYWVGRNIARAYVAQAPDANAARAALAELIAAQDPVALLRASGYAPR